MKFIFHFAILFLAQVETVPEVNNLIQTDHQGHTIHMDVIHDIEDKTVMAIIGDVSQYENGIPTVNFHDYKSGYGVLKIINRRTCILTKTPIPMATAEKYRTGVTNDVEEHFINFKTNILTNQDVREIAGLSIASFCDDYNVIHGDAIPAKQYERDTQNTTSEHVWCVFTLCKFDTNAFETAIKNLFG